jgi:serine/threonine-protein kinase RsbW
MRISYTLYLPRDAATVPLVRALCQEAMTRVGVRSDSVDDVGLAITEACTNVVVHAARGGQYEVQVEFEADDCHIRVIDTGVGFVAPGIDRPMPRPTADGGRGITLMGQLMDQIQFDSNPESGTVVHLRKRLDLADSSPLWRHRSTPTPTPPTQVRRTLTEP